MERVEGSRGVSPEIEVLKSRLPASLHKNVIISISMLGVDFFLMKVLSQNASDHQEDHLFTYKFNLHYPRFQFSWWLAFGVTVERSLFSEQGVSGKLRTHWKVLVTLPLMVQKSQGQPPGMVLKPCKYWDVNYQPQMVVWDS